MLLSHSPLRETHSNMYKQKGFASKCYGGFGEDTGETRPAVNGNCRSWATVTPGFTLLCYLCGCLIFVHNKQFSKNKAKRSPEIKSKFPSSDPWSDPYRLPTPPHNKHCCSCLFTQQSSICMQMAVSIDEWKHCFSLDNISSLAISPAVAPLLYPPPHPS